MQDDTPLFYQVGPSLPRLAESGDIGEMKFHRILIIMY